MKKSAKKISEPRSPCPINYAVEVLGDKWSLLIVRDCLFANKSAYSDFLQSSEGISTNILANRLKKLEQNGMLEKLPDPLNGKKQNYLLTEKSITLASLITDLIVWGAANDESTGASAAMIKKIKKDQTAFSKGLQSRYRDYAKEIKTRSLIS